MKGQLGRYCLIVVIGANACRTEAARPYVTTANIQPLPANVRRGFCYAHTYRGGRGYGTESSRASKRALQSLGTRWLSLTPFGFMKTQTSGRVLLIDEMMAQAGPKQYFEKNQLQAETDEVVLAEIAQARAMGFRIQLKPHLWMMDETWRGQLNPRTPDGWQTFWETYRRFIFHYADMAAANDVEMLVIGVELDQTVVPHAKHWRQLIRDTRKRYDGDLVYAANWDAYHRVPFWEALDFIGVQFYPPLADDPKDETDSMRRRLDAALDRVDEVAQKVGKPVLLTEVGYRAVSATAVHPHEWPDPTARQIDAAAQARAYRVLLEGVRPRKSIVGLFLWKWYTDEVGDEGPAGFSPRDKPAAALIQQAFAHPDGIEKSATRR